VRTIEGEAGLWHGPMLRKVPVLTFWFWVIKLVTTALGEAVSDYLVKRFSPVPVVLVGFLAFVASLAFQLRARRYVAWLYWSVAAMVSVFGTMAADVAHVGFHIPYAVSVVLCAIALAVTFVVWDRTEHTLSIHSITTTRREAFYWAAATVTFALGTATGDFTAVTLHLGYLSSGILFACVFAIPAIGYWRFKMNSVIAFWFAYIVTRPVGASFADWFAKPISDGGLGHGGAQVSLVLLVVLVVLVAYLTVTGLDDPTRAPIDPSPAHV
jgi:uncharacterized membrane-anchored protein